jgi:hypothetical protein
MIGTNLQVALANILENYSVEDVLFALYCYADDQVRNDNVDKKEVLQRQVKALDLACELLETKNGNETYVLVY